MTLVNFVVFGIMSIILILSAISVVTARDLKRAALSLAVVLITISLIYFSLNSDFIGVIQILVYVGGVIVLFLFAILLTDASDVKLERAAVEINGLKKAGLAGRIVIPVLLAIVMLTTLSYSVFIDTGADVEMTTEMVGIEMLTTFVFPFEVLSLVLTAVVIGATFLARKDEEVKQ